MIADRHPVNCVNFGAENAHISGYPCSALDAEPRIDGRDSHPRLRIKCGALVWGDLGENRPVNRVNFETAKVDHMINQNDDMADKLHPLMCVNFGPINFGDRT